MSAEEIEVIDFGQGSRVFRSNKRKVAAIAKHAGISPKRQRLLFRLTQYLKPEKVLELGTSLGIATTAIALGNPSAVVTTIEGCSNTAKVAQEAFNSFQLIEIQLYAKPFETFFAERPSEKYNLVFVDGNHNKEATLHYFELLLKNTTTNAVLIFDDIYWSPQMTEAWEVIQKHPKVSVSIDTFQWGMVFFRPEQQKEHFIIRL
ncbi:class I SAM-dependent methyltransferase [Altibacter sp.]|uniref:O-methyltransferase n=1 Tax=Altibacter sp. TaxID=2024823 RepID=UPI0034230A5E